MKYYAIALAGDLCSCTLHGKTKIIVEEKERTMATVGDKAACGCSIIEGSNKVKLKGKDVAYQGAKLSSGGCIIGASSSHKIAL
jgi:uncharacterized Zn-binding protein involved in type VI secretion